MHSVSSIRRSRAIRDKGQHSPWRRLVTLGSMIGVKMSQRTAKGESLGHTLRWKPPVMIRVSSLSPRFHYPFSARI